MRPFAGSVAAMLSVMVLSACSPQDRIFLDAGVGTDLYASAVSQSAGLEDQYIQFLCDHAGISCSGLGLGSPSWTVIVQAGMNDIDQRCDAYLTWLDDRSRSQAPILKELSDLSVATQAIMATTPAGVEAITIVGIAFGLASNTFTNFNSRLLYEVNHSTVQSIVFGNDNRFRQDLMGKTINNRPAAIYALRSYLRLCMPFTIETSINNAVTLFEVGGIPSADANPNPLISANNVVTIVSNETSPFTVSTSTRVIEGWLYQNGVLNLSRGHDLMAWIKVNHISVSGLGTFVHSSKNETDRQKAILHFSLR
jgi:hypothetical protein